MKFQKLSDGRYRVVSRGSTMTLDRTTDGGWEMSTSNASTRAWNGFSSMRRFSDLDEVEKAYVTWRGIKDHIASTEAPAWDELDPDGGQLRYSMSSVIERRLILQPQAKYDRRAVEALILDSLFNPARYGNRTLTAGEARFIVICSAIFHGAELSGPVREATPQSIQIAPQVATIH